MEYSLLYASGLYVCLVERCGFFLCLENVWSMIIVYMYIIDSHTDIIFYLFIWFRHYSFVIENMTLTFS